MPDYGSITGYALTVDRPKNYLVVSQSDHLSCFNPADGSMEWTIDIQKNQQETTSGAQPKPAIWGDYVFFVAGNSTVKAVSLADGSEQWSYQLVSNTYASPIVGGNTLYIGTNTGVMYAFSPESMVPSP